MKRGRKETEWGERRRMQRALREERGKVNTWASVWKTKDPDELVAEQLARARALEREDGD